jgi:hypothetical protein
VADLRGRVLLLAAAAALVPAAAQAAPKAEVVCAFQDARIDESSDLVVHRGLLYTTNDSGDGPYVYVVSARDCATVGVTRFAEREPVDVEALTAGRANTLWAGDIGDNDGARSHVTVYRMPRPSAGDHQVAATAYDLVYADGARDAETLLVSPTTGRLYVVSKGLVGGTVYAAPGRLRADRTNVLVPVGSTGGLVTDGAFLPDGRHFVLRDYSSATLYRTAGMRPVARFDLPRQPQGEGIAVDGSDVLVGSEGEHAKVLRVPLPAHVARALHPAAIPTTSPSAPAPGEASPAADHSSSGRDWLRAAPYALAAAWVVLVGWALRAALRRSRRRR